MITSKAIRAFLRRPRDDWSWYKDLTDSELEARCDRLPFDPPIWTRLKRHQKQGLLLGIRLKKLAYWYDTGTGKTLMMLALARYFQEKGTLNHVLVLVPNLVNKAEWVREIKKHTRMSYLTLDGTSEQKWRALNDTDATVIIETYAGLVRLLSTLKESKTGKSKKKHWEPSPKRIKAVSKLCNMVVLDESSAVGNKASLNNRIVRKLAWAADYVYQANGTPFGRDPEPLWGQMYCIDKGETLGETLGLFRGAFYKEVSNGFGTEHEFKPECRGQIHELLKHRSLRCKADEADLPRVVRIAKTIDLGTDAEAVYDKALASLRKSRGRITETKNEFLRLRQICSGFLGYKDDDSGKRAQFEFKDNPKLELLLDLLWQITPDYKAVVFNEFTFSGSMICRELAKLNIPHTRIFGGTKDAQAELLRFVEDERCRVLVLQSQAGGTGLNLQCAKYLIYFESPVSPRVRIQTEARVVRQGSEFEKTYVYDLLAGSIERAIIGMHREGRDLLDAILNGEDLL